MSKKKNQKTTLLRWGKDYVSQADHSRLTQAKSNYDKLPLELQNKFFMSLVDTSDFYPQKSVWTAKENQRLRLVWNWMPTDEMCDHFFCSHTSLIGQAAVLRIHDINDKRPLSSEDLDLIKKLQDDGKDIRDIAKVFGMTYDHVETKTFDKGEQEIIEMQQQTLIGGEE